jgi:hypothetical protein
MNNQKKYQDEDSSNEKTISKLTATPSYYMKSSSDNIFRIQLAEPEPSLSIFTVEPFSKQNKVIGKKRKRNEVVDQKSKNNKQLNSVEFKKTIDNFEQEFKQIGLINDIPKAKKSTVNLGLLLLSLNIFDFVKVDSNKLNKTLENTLIKDGVTDINFREILNRLKDTKDMRLVKIRQMINKFNNMDIGDSQIFEIFSKIVNYYDNKLNVCEFEVDAINWKDINIHKTNEKISSHKNLLINKTKNISSVERVYDRGFFRSMIYLLNKKGKPDQDLIEAFGRTKVVLDRRYESKLAPKYLSLIENIYEGKEKCNNILKNIISLVKSINNNEDVPDDLLYTLFEEEKSVKKAPRKSKQLEVQNNNIICNEKFNIAAEDRMLEKSISTNNIIKIDTSAFLDNKEIEKRIHEEKKKLFRPSDYNNVLFNVNVNLNLNLNVNVTNNESGTKSTIIKIDYDSINKHINNLPPPDDAVTITASEKTLSASSVSYKSKKKKSKIFMVSKVKREEFQLMPIKNINFEIRPTFKKNKKCITNTIINN